MKIFKIVIAAILLATMSNFALAQENKTETIKVKGVTCAADLKTIADNVRKVEGVVSVEPLVQGATSTFEVVYNPDMVEREKIVTAIENTGGCSNPNEKPYRVKP